MTRLPTQEQIAAWLNRLYSDRSLPAHDFRIAFALGQAADAAGFIGVGAIAKIARTHKAEEGTEPIADVLGRLCTGRYLEACGGLRKSEGFRIVAMAKAKPTPKIVPSRRRGGARSSTSMPCSWLDSHKRKQMPICGNSFRFRPPRCDAKASLKM